jgi:hypothetical protein
MDTVLLFPFILPALLVVCQSLLAFACACVYTLRS